jgi:hypothetical protein
MTTLCDLPVELFYSNILPYLFYNGNEYCHGTMNYARINKFWYNIIYSDEFVNIILKIIHRERPKEFENIVNPLERMKLIYEHQYIVGIKMTPMANCIYDVIVTNNIDIDGHINTITMLNKTQIIEDNLLEPYININIEKVNISICFAAFPNNYNNMFKFTLNINNDIEDVLFSTNRPELYTFNILGFCKINEYTTTTTLFE